MWNPFRREVEIEIGVPQLFTLEDSTFLKALRSETARGFVLVAADIDPTSANEGDGYVQRVMAIDAALAPRSRVYLIFHPAGSRQPTYTSLGDGLWRVEIAERDAVGVEVVAVGSREPGHLHT